MKTHEKFFKPGLVPVDEIIEHLPETPRELHPIGVQFSMVWRIIFFIFVSLLLILFIHTCIHLFIETAIVIYWAFIFVLIPIWLVIIPWKLTSTYKNKLKSFRYCQKIYQNGIPVKGYVNTLTRVTGREQNCHHIEHTWTSSLSKVRIDYTFEIDNTVKTGTALLREQNMNYLSMNSEICVLYLPDNPSENMIFPIPGNEFFEYLKKS